MCWLRYLPGSVWIMWFSCEYDGKILPGTLCNGQCGLCEQDGEILPGTLCVMGNVVLCEQDGEILPGTLCVMGDVVLCE